MKKMDNLSHWKVAVCYSSSVKIQLQEKWIYARSRSNHMLTVFYLPSLFEIYKTMWFCFLSKAGGEFLSGLCVAWTLCCLIWLVKSQVNYMENLCWLVPLMAWVVQVDQAGEKRQGLPVRWEPSKPMEVGTGTCWFFADSTWKAEPFRCSFPTTSFKTSVGTMWKV